MSQKRHPEDDNKEASDGSVEPQEKRPRGTTFKELMIEVTKRNAFQNFACALEPILRRVVKEEVEVALTKHLGCRNKHHGKQIYPSTSRSLELQFINKLYLPIFTGAKIEGEDNPTVNVSLVDAFTGELVISGPESSMKVDIVVLEGDFEGDEDGNWTFEEFEANIVRERDGKKPLLSGDLFLHLNKGFGATGGFAFTDNSSWTRSRKFRLGAKVANGYFSETRVKEAKTEAFVVKDHRGELYKKHYPPSLSDEVWRLEKIGKDGAFHKRLSCENINSVKDFLKLLCMDSQKLRNILGSGMSSKMWELTVEHARTCTLDDHKYLYSPHTEQRMGVVFNVVGEVKGLLLDKQFITYSELSDMQKVDAQRLVKAAFEHWDGVVLFNDGAVSTWASDVPCVPSDGPTEDNPFSNFSSFIHPSISSPDFNYSVLSPEGVRNPSVHALHGISTMECRNELEPHSFSTHDIYKDSTGFCRIADSFNLDAESLSQTFCFEDQLRYFDTEASSQLKSLSSGSRSWKAQAKWMVLRAVLMWRFSIKKIVARKKSRMRAILF